MVSDILRNINDPEHPLTLEQLHVIEENNITVDNKINTVHVFFTPTIPHCSMATLIGLSIRVLLLRTLPSRYKVQVEVTPGSHASEHAVNKQLADKERVAAALENKNLIQVIEQCIDIGDHLTNEIPTDDIQSTNTTYKVLTKDLDLNYECKLGQLDDDYSLNKTHNYIIQIKKKLSII